jgi:cysteine synthase
MFEVVVQDTTLQREGIGQGRVTENLKGTPIDDAFLIKDTDAVEMVSGFFVIFVIVYQLRY